MTIFMRLLEVQSDQKADALRQSVRAVREDDVSADMLRSVFEREPSKFSAIPGTPFAYWLSDKMLEIFRKGHPFEARDRMARVGLQTSDDKRFVRLWTEVAPATAGRRWHSFAKGGRLAPFYSDLSLVVAWAHEGLEMKAFAETTSGTTHWSRKLPNSELYGRPGITWPLRASRFRPQALFAGSVFSIRGPAVFLAEDDLPVALALFNSSVFDYLFKTMLGRFGFPEFAVGILQLLPWVDPNDEQRKVLTGLSRRAWSLRRRSDAVRETSHAFVLPSALNVTGMGCDLAEGELEQLQGELDDAAFKLYGIGPGDRILIESSSKRVATDEATDSIEAGHVDDSEEDKDSVGAAFNVTFSWLVGVCFGRFDPRLATGERPLPPEPAPFDALPSRSPGMYPEDEEPTDLPEILVDDEGHADDLTARVLAVAERVQVDVPGDLRAWHAKEFFPLHIKMYSKSGRKAPIYWQLATASASYSVWLYIHAFSKDTLFRVQNDYIGGEKGKLVHEERRLESLRLELRDGATAAQRKELTAQQSLVDELRAFLAEVKRVAPLWNPNLDDGVIINFAPLWRLVPQNKSWQKELKSTWDALCDGKYDWAHLAMYLWPERVVRKCATDRSLAIAHGLEDVLWVEGKDGKWTARKKPTRIIDDVVRERTSSAVKSALKSLREAPASSGSVSRARSERRKGANEAPAGGA
jgi:hypothetical protein